MKFGRSFSVQQNIGGSADDFSHNGIGIVHFGPGAFHRAHQAVYTHDVLAKNGGDWRILGVSLQSTHTADALNAQDGCYTVVTRGTNQTDMQIIKSIAHAEAAVRGKEKIFEALASPSILIVSMTVTEKAYGIILQSGRLDLSHATIDHDIDNPDDPVGVLGFIVKGLKLRKTKGLKPFTVVCCDNLPQNGNLVRKGILEFATLIGEPELATWIEKNGAFPNSMVDRITPATKPGLIDEVSERLGYIDKIPVETEPFSQWIFEDNFASERPEWEDAGALIVDDVTPYEEMKLRMLNGTHSFIAYMGFLTGKKYVRDVMADGQMASLILRHIRSAARTLSPLHKIDLNEYGDQLVQRFANPSIAHETFQIAMDGSQKMPQRIFEPALVTLKQENCIKPFALATAIWLRYCSGVHDNGDHYPVRDPRSEELRQAFLGGQNDPVRICNGFFQLDDLFPTELAKSSEWKIAVSQYLDLILNDGIQVAITSICAETVVGKS